MKAIASLSSNISSNLLLYSSIRWHSKSDKSDPEGENNSTKGKKKNAYHKKPGASQAIFRSYLDAIKYIPIVEHISFLFYPFNILELNKSEYDNLYEYIQKTGKQYIAMSATKNPLIFQKDAGLLPMFNGRPISRVPLIKSDKDVYNVGALCKAVINEKQENSTANIFRLAVMPISRIKIAEWIEKPNPLGLVRIEEILEQTIKDEDLDLEQQVLLKTSKKLLEEVLKFIPPFANSSVMQNVGSMQANELVQNALAILTTSYQYSSIYYKKAPEIIQDIFAETNLTERLKKLSNALLDVTQRLHVVLELNSQAEAATMDIEANKKMNYGDEKGRKMPPIKEKLSEHHEDVNRFRNQLMGKKVPPAVVVRFEEEVNRYLSMDKNNPEASNIRTYLDILTTLPWGVTSEDSIDLDKAKKILDEDHYGMDDIKQRILEILAVGKLHNKVQGKILCFVGPPGVGKTSIGESIAKSLNRKFMRITVGGDRDTNTLKGFRRTYIGAMPGKIVQGLKRVQVDNPVIMIDEIDKLGMISRHGDPSSVLLEVLDPEQNIAFTDDYLDIPVNLSKVLFLCTANVTHTIMRPLLDRMEVIQISGYTHEEKKQIFEKYLRPKAIINSGMQGKEKEYVITEGAVKKMIEDYCREPGVRGLQRGIKRIMEKLALKLVSQEKNLVVDVNNLDEYIGEPPFHSARIYPNTPVGVVCGLGYNDRGGSILYIEAKEANTNKSSTGTGQIKITGSLGDVMKESVLIANTCAKNFLAKRFPGKKAAIYLDNHDIHIHVPEGAIPKEGPSAGVTLTTSLISLALNTPTTQNIAMTGEITLKGKVLPIGGVKEKVLAAQREGIKKVILPKQNEKEFGRLPEFLRKGSEVFYAEEYSDIFKIMFGDVKVE